MDRRLIIYIMGVPGTGKTTFAQNLSNDLMTPPHLCTDIVKAMLQGTSDEPVFTKVSHNAWQLFGEQNDSNVISGYEYFSERLFGETCQLADRLMQTHKLVIVEGVAISPKMINTHNCDHIAVLLTSNNLNSFRQNKMKLRHDTTNNWDLNSRAIDLIEQYLVDQGHLLLPELIYGDTADTSYLRSDICRIVKSYLDLEAAKSNALYI